MGEAKEETEWIDVQRRTFTGWTNNVLKKNGLTCEVLTEDFDDGLLLLNMFEILTGKKVPKKYNKKPKFNPQKLENLTIALAAFQDDGLVIVNIDSKDVMDGDDKLMLGLIWSLILKYQIAGGDDDGGAKDALLKWVQTQLEPYPIKKVTNFTTSWSDSTAITALTDSLAPGIADVTKCGNDSVGEIGDAMNKAELNFGIPQVLRPEDMNAAVDDLSTMTYVSYFKDYHDKHGVQTRQFADGESSRAEGIGLVRPVNNSPAVFKVFCKDKNGGDCKEGGDDVSIAVRKVGGGSVGEASSKDGGGGAGGDGGPGGGGPESDGAVGGGDGGEAGANTGDAGGAGGDAGGTGDGGGGGGSEDASDKVAVRVSDNGDGTYNIEYAADEPGDYEIDVLVNGAHVPGSTFHVTVLPGEQPELMSGKFVYIVQAKDRDGNDLTHGGADWQVSVKGPEDAEVDVKTTDNEDGTYSAEYELYAIEGSDAVFEVCTEINGKHVGSSPFKHRLGPKPSAFQKLKNLLK